MSEPVDVHVYVHAPATDPGGLPPPAIAVDELLAARVASLEAAHASLQERLDVVAHNLWIACGGDHRRKLRGRDAYAGPTVEEQLRAVYTPLSDRITQRRRTA